MKEEWGGWSGHLWGERMWVEIVAVKRRHIVGVLRNRPIGIPRLDWGDRVKFNRDHIIDILWEVDSLSGPAAEVEGDDPIDVDPESNGPDDYLSDLSQKLPTTTSSGFILDATALRCCQQKTQSCPHRNRWIVPEGSRRGGPGEDTSSPGLLANPIAPATVAQFGHRCPAVKRECPALRRNAAHYGGAIRA